VDRFALTSNNISYAQVGDMLHYWAFFPTEQGWGRIPAMGFGDVAESNHPDVASGERVFGFFPMARHLVIQAVGVNPQGFSDAAAHRAETAPVYRLYTGVATDTLYDAGYEDETLLLRGLFLTSFLVDDFLADQGDFGAETFVIASASSKTAIALAHQLSQRRAGKVVGLTSQRNRAFVAGLGYYDEVLPYGNYAPLPAAEPAVFVDHSGDGAVIEGIHGHFGEQLRHSCIVGATHWNAKPRSPDLPGPEPTFFFAPAQAQKRSQQWGPGEFQQRIAGAWAGFRNASRDWLHVVRGAGPEALERAYREILEGRARPDQGHVLSLAPAARD